MDDKVIELQMRYEAEARMAQIEVTAEAMRAKHAAYMAETISDARRASQDELLKKVMEDPVESQWAKELHSRLIKEPKAAKKLSGDALTVLVDGDLIAYRCSAATDGVSYEIGTPEDGVVHKMKYHKDALRAAKKLEDSGDFTDVTVTKVYDPEPQHFATQNMDKLMGTAIDNMHKIYKRKLDIRVFLTADHLFRESVSPTYKKSRIGIRKPTHLKACKKHLEDKWNAETVTGYEADDMMSMLATSIGPKDCVIMTLDKDLDQIAGMHYNFVKCAGYEVSEAEGRHNFWMQVLQGDKTDDIPGLVGVGPVNAQRILQNCEDNNASEHEYYKTVLKAYLKWTEREDGESDRDFISKCVANLGMNARLLWLCREPEKLWDVPAAPKEVHPEPEPPETDYSVRLAARRLAADVDKYIGERILE